MLVLLSIIIAITTIAASQTLHVIALSYDTDMHNPPLFQNRTSSISDPAEYTVMVYMVGSDLEEKYHEASNDIEEMKKVNLNPKINIVLQTGGANASPDNRSNREVDFTKYQRYHISNHTLIPDPPGKPNMGNATTLSDFIKWAHAEFPAKKYGIILWDHGNALNGFGNDVIHGDKLDLTELSEAFHMANQDDPIKFEFLGFDSCLMATLDVALKLHNFSRYMIASEEIEPNWGWDYTTILQSLSMETNQTGNSIGSTIIDSYINKSRHIAEAENFGADRDITLSVIDLEEIPNVNKTMIDLVASFIAQKEFTVKSQMDLLKALSLSEHYGQDASSSIGSVDIYDFMTSLEKYFPNLRTEINAVRFAIERAVIDNDSGLSKPFARGLAVYLPLLGEYDDNTVLNSFDLPNWKNFIFMIKGVVDNDPFELEVKSEKNDQGIVARVYGYDIANAYAEIKMNSSDGDFRVYQSINHHNIDDEGFLRFNSSRLLELCNELKCIPASVMFTYLRDSTFAYIPVELVSNGNKSEISLLYEVINNTNFIFLGGIQKFEPTEPIPKLKVNLKKGDKISTLVGDPDSLLSSKDVDLLPNFISKLGTKHVSNGPKLEVADPQKIEPRYVGSESFLIRFLFCDYSNKCTFSRNYQMGGTHDNVISRNKINVSNDTAEHFVMMNLIANNSADTVLPFTYINPKYGFQIQYPKDWIILAQDVYDEQLVADVKISDPVVLSLYPRHLVINKGTDSQLPTIEISVNDYGINSKNYQNFSNFSKIFKEGFYKTTDECGIHDTGYHEEEICYEYPPTGNESKKQMGYLVAFIFNGKVYTINFQAPKANFNDYINASKQIIRSFKPYTIDPSLLFANYVILNATNINQEYKYYANETISREDDIVFLNYTNDRYAYEINYPIYSVDDIKPQFIAGQPFQLPPKNTGNTVIIDSFYKNETDKMKKSLLVGVELPSFDNVGLAVLSRETKSFLKDKPLFTVIKDELKSFKNNATNDLEVRFFDESFQTLTQERFVNVLTDETLYAFWLKSPASHYDKANSLFEKMINSFEMI